jgi:Cu2+-containing amine oxidase
MSQHPLDRLTGGEIELNRTILDRAGLIRPTTRFPLVMLHEPPKREVLAWEPTPAADHLPGISRGDGSSLRGSFTRALLAGLL